MVQPGPEHVARCMCRSEPSVHTWYLHAKPMAKHAGTGVRKSVVTECGTNYYSIRKLTSIDIAAALRVPEVLRASGCA